MTGNMKFELLASSIKNINMKAGNAAKSAVNQLTEFFKEHNVDIIVTFYPE